MRSKVVVVTFWATWCAPCAYSLPKLEALRIKVGGRLEVLGVSVDDEEDDRRFSTPDLKAATGREGVCGEGTTGIPCADAGVDAGDGG
jgi:thiol-disulfide isomerase/thioredoxin